MRFIELTKSFLSSSLFRRYGRARKNRDFFKRVVEYLREKPGVRPENVNMHLIENAREDWSFGDGDAQYVILPSEQWK